MSVAGMLEQPDLPGEDPVSAFHQDIVNQNPNFRKLPRHIQEQHVMNYLTGASETFRQLEPTSPLRQYKVREFLDGALQQTTGEKVQHAAEELGPPGLAAAAGLTMATGGAGLVPTAIASGLAGAAGEFIPQLRPATTGEIPPPWSETFQNAGLTATTYPFLDAGMHGVSKGVSALSRRMFVPHADEAGRQMGLEAIKEFGGTPGITQRGAGPVLQFGESISEAAIPGRGMAVRRQQTVDDAVADMTLQTIRKASPIIRSDEETARLFFQESENLRGLYKMQAAAKYKVVDDLTQHNVGVNMRPVIQMTAPGVGPGKKYPGMNAPGAPKTVTDAPVTADVMRQFEVPELRDPNTGAVLAPGYRGHEGFFALANSMNKGQASFSDAQRFSSALKQIARDNPDYPGFDPIHRKAGRLAGQMAQKVDAEMDRAAQHYTQQSIQALTAQGVPLAQAQAQVRDFAQEYQKAKAFYRENVAEKFETETFKGLAAALRNEPAKFSRLAMAADSPGKLKALREAAPNMWPDMQARVLRSVFEKAVETHPSGAGLELDELISRGLVTKVNGEKLTAEFARLGQDYVRELTSGTVTLHDVQRLGAAIEVAGQRPKGQGQMFVTLTATGAAGSLLLTPFGANFMDPKTAGLAILSPNILALALTRPGVLNMMERGILAGPKSEAFAKFTAFSFAEHMKDLREKQLEAEHLSKPSNQLPNPIGPALSQAPMPPPPALPQVPQLPVLRQQRLVGQPPNF